MPSQADVSNGIGCPPQAAVRQAPSLSPGFFAAAWREGGTYATDVRRSLREPAFAERQLPSDQIAPWRSSQAMTNN